MKHRAEAMIDPATDRIILTIARHRIDGGEPVVEVGSDWSCGSRAIEYVDHDVSDADEQPPLPSSPTCTLSIEEAVAIGDALARAIRTHRDAQPSGEIQHTRY